MDTSAILALKELQWSKINYVPNISQRPIHDDFHRVRLISGGEGSGKSLVTAKEYIGWYPFWKLVYIVAPKYQSGRPEFDYICNDLLANHEIRQSDISRPAQGQMTIHTRRNDGEVIVLSSEDGPKTITGTGRSPDCIMMVEAGKQTYDVYLACRARISRSHGFLLLSGTIEQSERWYPELIERWQVDNPEGAKSFILPTWTNTALYPGGENDEEILALKRTFTPEYFMERFGAVPCPPASQVFKEFKFTTHVSEKILYDKNLPVEVWVDPGYSGSHYAVLFVQFHTHEGTGKKEVWVVDEIYADHAVHKEVIDQAKKKELWPNVKSGVGDIVMRTHPQAGQSPVEVWATEAHIALRSRNIRVEEGIDRHRTFLKDPETGSPRIFFNPKCKGVLKEYGNWQRKVIGENEYGKPDDSYCDSLKAINYGLITNFGFVERPKVEKPQRAGLYMDAQLDKAWGR